MSTTDAEAAEVAVQMVSNYLTGDMDAMTDPAERILDHPRLLGAVMVELTVIAGEVLRTSTEGTDADPQAILRDIVRRLRTHN